MRKIEDVKETLKEQLDNNRYHATDACYDAIRSLIEDYDFENRDEFEENVYQVTGEAFIYYADAFNYLRDEWITDFTDAIREGFGTNVCTIATYYLEEEIWDFMREHMDLDDAFEGGDGDDDDEEVDED